MVDPIFEHPRLAAIYDVLDSDRGDLDVYAAVADELGARRVLDIGCGTGTFALVLAERGLDVTGVDPARASLDIARAKPGAEGVCWIDGKAHHLPPLRADLATMTGNAAQAIVDRRDWAQTLHGAHDALRPGGHLVFETRDPSDEAWRQRNREASYRNSRPSAWQPGQACEDWLSSRTAEPNRADNVSLGEAELGCFGRKLGRKNAPDQTTASGRPAP